MQKEKAEHEKAGEQAKKAAKAAAAQPPAPSATPTQTPPTILSAHSTPTGNASLSPHSLNYAKSETSQDVTPKARSRFISKGRGRPKKTPSRPSYDDKPVNASKEEVLKWQRKKNTAEWRYTKLTSEDAEAYRENKTQRVKQSVSQNHQQIIDAAAGKESVYEHVPDSSPKMRVREKSRQR